jgi:hypothetical protein
MTSLFFDSRVWTASPSSSKLRRKNGKGAVHDQVTDDDQEHTANLCHKGQSKIRLKLCSESYDFLMVESGLLVRACQNCAEE